MPEAYVPPDKNKGIKTVSVLFIVFGILGLLTLPGLILGTVMQLLMPQFQRGGPAMMLEPGMQNEAPSDPESTTPSTIPPGQADESDAVQDTERSQKPDFQADMNARMMQLQKFNPVGFTLGLINVLLSGCLLWSGIQLIRLRLSGALLGRKVCMACSAFEVTRMLFGVWTGIQVAKIFHGIQPPDTEAPFHIETVMIGWMIVGIVVSVVYGTAKLVMYILCYRFLGREPVQAQLS